MVCHKRIITRSPNGLDIGHLGILPQFCQNPFWTIQWLLRYCQFHVLCFFLVKADGDHLWCQIAKKQNGLMQRFFHFYTLLYLVRDAILKVYSHLILKQLIARIILTQIWPNSLAVIKILSFSCSALLLVTANGGHLGM